MAHLKDTPNIALITLDPTSAESVKEAFKQISAHGPLDVLVNNAGQTIMAPTLDFDIDEAQQMYNINYFGALRVTQVFAPLIIASKGTLVYTASIASICRAPYLGVYAGSKAAMAQMADTLRSELRPFGVRVLTVMTGGVSSRTLDAGHNYTVPDGSFYKQIEEQVVKRARGDDGVPRKTPAEYAKRVVMDVQRGTNGRVYRGGLASFNWFMSGYVPVSVWDWVATIGCGLGGIKSLSNATRDKSAIVSSNLATQSSSTYGSKSKRAVPMQVLALGMPRTGTNSICKAFELLDIPCYHGFTLVANPSHADFWNAALDWKLFGKGSKPTVAFWDQFLGNYGALADLPGIIFFAELIEAYPDAKIVLVERNIERWYISFDTAIIKNVWNPVLRFLSKVDPYFTGPLGSVSGRWTSGWLKASSMEEMRRNARPKYREHYAAVRAAVPKDRLLEFDLKSGWGPLCEFLGKDVPEAEFPNTNDSKEFAEKMKGYVRTGFLNLIWRLLPVVIAVFAALLAFKWVGPFQELLFQVANKPSDGVGGSESQ